MIEYIEREALITHMKDLPRWFEKTDGSGWEENPLGLFEPDNVIASIENATTADVVPRAELEHTLAEVREAKKLYVKDIAKAKAEVAREIFEEIENKFFGQIDEDSGEGILCIYAQDYYEDIKKKYTEETT